MHKKLIVTCADTQGSVKRVANALQQIGFEVENVMEFVGSISGSWDREIEELEEIPEVIAVETSEMKYPQDGPS